MNFNGNRLATGTGFVVMHESRPYLITNWHNLAGRRPETNKMLSEWGVTPDSVSILHNKAGEVGAWLWKTEPVVDEDDGPLWLEHSAGGREVDVVALPLTDIEGVDFFAYSLEEDEASPLLTPSTDVNIIGFPFAKGSGGGIGIWARGSIASEPYVNYEGLAAISDR